MLVLFWAPRPCIAAGWMGAVVRSALRRLGWHAMGSTAVRMAGWMAAGQHTQEHTDMRQIPGAMYIQKYTRRRSAGMVMRWHCGHTFLAPSARIQHPRQCTCQQSTDASGSA